MNLLINSLTTKCQAIRLTSHGMLPWKDCHTSEAVKRYNILPELSRQVVDPMEKRVNKMLMEPIELASLLQINPSYPCSDLGVFTDGVLHKRIRFFYTNLTHPQVPG